jgi:hypothetical protein
MSVRATSSTVCERKRSVQGRNGPELCGTPHGQGWHQVHPVSTTWHHRADDRAATRSRSRRNSPVGRMSSVRSPPHPLRPEQAEEPARARAVGGRRPRGPGRRPRRERLPGLRRPGPLRSPRRRARGCEEPGARGRLPRGAGRRRGTRRTRPRLHGRHRRPGDRRGRAGERPGPGGQQHQVLHRGDRAPTRRRGQGEAGRADRDVPAGSGARRRHRRQPDHRAGPAPAHQRPARLRPVAGHESVRDPRHLLQPA